MIYIIASPPARLVPFSNPHKTSKSQFETPQKDLFRMHLENMLDTSHELIKLSQHIDWGSLDREWGALFVSTKGAPAIRTRLIAGLHYLKHLHDLSDEQAVKGCPDSTD